MTHHHRYGPSYQASVVLDIGGEIGALVIVAGAADVGREIEVSPVGGSVRTHVAVRARHLDTGTMYCAVYPGLVAGRYTIWLDQRTPIAEVSVRGAEIARFTWPSPRPALARSTVDKAGAAD